MPSPASLKGVRTYADKSPALRSSFRTSPFIPEGTVAAHVHECVVVDYNLNTWTVDVRGKFDQKTFLDVQVSSPYLHADAGEGIYVIPEVGAKCHVCEPGDGSPPYVLDFILPMEELDDAVPDNHSSGVCTATYAGGRQRGKPGDICIRGRDGNFITLHRGGVLQIGASSLSQRIYIPLQHVMTDISQNYHHHNMGGSISWGVQMGPSAEHPPTCWKQTFRLFADDAKASLRVAVGTFKDVVAEDADGYQDDIPQLDLDDEPIVCEVVLAPERFEGASGDLTSDTAGAVKLRYFFNRAGGAFLRAEGSVFLGVRKKVRVRAGDTIEVMTDRDFLVTAEGSARLQAGSTIEISGSTIKLNGGTKPIATVGSLVDVAIVTPVPIMVGGVPGTISVGAILTGIVKTGNPTIMG